MTGVPWRLCMLAKVARINVFSNKLVNAREPIVSRDIFKGFGNTAVASEGSVIMFLQDIHAQTW